jgi:hypothetical protein
MATLARGILHCPVRVVEEELGCSIVFLTVRLAELPNDLAFAYTTRGHADQQLRLLSGKEILASSERNTDEWEDVTPQSQGTVLAGSRSELPPPEPNACLWETPGATIAQPV